MACSQVDAALSAQAVAGHPVEGLGRPSKDALLEPFAGRPGRERGGDPRAVGAQGVERSTFAGCRAVPGVAAERQPWVSPSPSRSGAGSRPPTRAKSRRSQGDRETGDEEALARFQPHGTDYLDHEGARCDYRDRRAGGRRQARRARPVHRGSGAPRVGSRSFERPVRLGAACRAAGELR
jgi:hypothetical protein